MIGTTMLKISSMLLYLIVAEAAKLEFNLEPVIENDGES